MMTITTARRRGRLQATDISIRITAPALLACWILAACSSPPAAQDAAVDTGSSPAKDGATDRNFILDGGVCLIPLGSAQPFGGCRPTFGDTSWRTQVCPTSSSIPPFVYVSEQLCTGYRSRKFDLGTHGWTCYYEPGSGALVAGDFVDDVPDLCDNTSAFVTSGEVPTKGTCNAQVPVDNPCNVPGDGGADADGSTGGP